MKYIVATFSIDCQDDMYQTACDLLVSSAGDAGFESFESNNGCVLGYAPKCMFNKKKLDEELLFFPLENVKIEYFINDVEDKNWNENWENIGFSPIHIDNKCVIYDARHTNSSMIDNSIGINIFIEATQSFGTGTHQTTRMIISEIMKRDIKGMRVLDCGCGTGILGIAASKLGAAEVVGYDIDEWSVDNAKHNAILNDAENICILHGNSSVLENVHGTFDIVAANINRNILLADMKAFSSVMKHGSMLFLSGFYETDTTMLLDKASDLGLNKEALRVEDDWACLALEKA